MNERISTAEAASRLGVKPETIYAYVSRGVLTSERQAGQKGSTFAVAEIEQLVRRRAAGRGRLDVPVASAITSVTDGRVSYRGHELPALANEGWAFEDIAELLWTGTLGAKPWRAPREVDAAVRRAIRALPTGATPTQRIMAGALAAGAADPFRGERSAEGVARMGRALLSAIVNALPSAASASPSDLGRQLWQGLEGTPDSAGPLMDCALTVVADHGLATSTLAARIAASTRAGPHSALLAALGAFAGPLHGAASRRVHELFAEAEQHGVNTAIAAAMRPNGTLPGVGHVIHKVCDPRYELLWEGLAGSALDDRRLSIVDAVRTRIANHTASPLNVDFALGALTYAAGMSVDASEMVFAIGRTAGWLAHCIEEYLEAPLRFRAVGRYRA